MQHEHDEAQHPSTCDACRAAWLALRRGTVSPPEPEVVEPRRPRPDLEGNVERPRGVETLF